MRLLLLLVALVAAVHAEGLPDFPTLRAAMAPLWGRWRTQPPPGGTPIDLRLEAQAFHLDLPGGRRSFGFLLQEAGPAGIRLSYWSNQVRFTPRILVTTEGLAWYEFPDDPQPTLLVRPDGSPVGLPPSLPGPAPAAEYPHRPFAGGHLVDGLRHVRWTRSLEPDAGGFTQAWGRIAADFRVSWAPSLWGPERRADNPTATARWEPLVTDTGETLRHEPNHSPSSGAWLAPVRPFHRLRRLAATVTVTIAEEAGPEILLRPVGEGAAPQSVPELDGDVVVERVADDPHALRLYLPAEVLPRVHVVHLRRGTDPAQDLASLFAMAIVEGRYLHLSMAAPVQPTDRPVVRLVARTSTQDATLAAEDIVIVPDGR
jgi:hypothetical protein